MFRKQRFDTTSTMQYFMKSIIIIQIFSLYEAAMKFSRHRFPFDVPSNPADRYFDLIIQRELLEKNGIVIISDELIARNL
jgi:hypothetical protein